MLKKIFVICCFVTIGIQLHSQHIVKDSKFSITFPAKPEYSNQKIEVEDSGMDSHTYSFYDEGSSTRLVFSYTDYSSDFLKDADPTGFLLSTIDEILYYYEMESEFTEEIEINSTKGYSFSGTDYFEYVRSYIFYDSNRLYKVIVIGEDPYDIKAVDDFFESFKIIK